MQIVINKWNNGLYEIRKDDGKEIEMKRCSDGVILTIAKSEFSFSYKPFIKKTIEK